MDPNVAFQNLCTFIEDDEWGDAAEVADALLDWTVKGGLPPTITGKPAVDRLITCNLCEAVSAWDVV